MEQLRRDLRRLPPELQPQGSRLCLYSHYSLSPELPAFVRYALERVQECGFQVILLTNKHELNTESNQWLQAHSIGLCMVRNEGFDFGMWTKYLRVANCQSLERLWLLNDSVLYYRPIFQDFVTWAEAQSADAVSLTDNWELAYHLQSYCLYLKTPACSIAKTHMDQQGILKDYTKIVRKLEVGLSGCLLTHGMGLKALYPQTPDDLPMFLQYIFRIPQGLGFIKRKLLEHRFSPIETLFLTMRNGQEQIDTDYYKLIRETGSPDARCDLGEKKSGSAAL